MYYGIVKIILEQTDLDALLGETPVKKTKYTVALNLIHWSASASTTLTKEEEVTQMCSLLKFHEEGTPTRPIVFTINFTTCTDVKELAIHSHQRLDTVPTWLGIPLLLWGGLTDYTKRHHGEL